MGYELQSPIELKDGVGNFEPIPCRKNSNIRDSQVKAAKLYDIGFPVRRGGDKPVVVTIHGKWEFGKRKYTYNTVISEKGSKDMMESVKEEDEEIMTVPTKDMPMEINLGTTEEPRPVY